MKLKVSHVTTEKLSSLTCVTKNTTPTGGSLLNECPRHDLTEQCEVRHMDVKSRGGRRGCKNFNLLLQV